MLQFFTTKSTVTFCLQSSTEGAAIFKRLVCVLWSNRADAEELEFNKRFQVTQNLLSVHSYTNLFKSNTVF